MRLQRGFSLVEILVVVTIAGILLSIAAPAVLDMVMNNRMSSQANELIADFAYARSQAASLGTRVTACISSNSTSCTGSSWAEGRIVFADTDGDGALDTGEEILRVSAALSGSNTIAVSGLTTSSVVTFRPSGIPAGLSGASAAFKICDYRTGSEIGRTITVALTGRVSVTKTACP